MAQNGDFVTATVELPEEHPTRQGILDGKLLHCESGETYKIVKIHAVVEKLYGSTLAFYNNHHAVRRVQTTEDTDPPWKCLIFAGKTCEHVECRPSLDASH